ncbi:hypothetical protein [Streptomyces cavernicola]|uniref:Uncharacterized protein n=1 Tax=Streptomyces cavernicola TaxID=3043613 RepID=A0ABT6S6J4_9ACTN|nr:hypothetical protein [Streptomyces sp. B-S-A6]MDI3403726.1 hypothetical protein [Streptomyces sp. B-S-A6]
MSWFMYDALGVTVDEPGPETVRRVLDSLAARAEVLRLFGLLVAGDITAVEASPWER